MNSVTTTAAKPAIAFFDFDGTLLIRESRTLCSIPAVRRGLVAPSLGMRIFASYVGYKFGVFPKDKANAIAFQCYRGRTPAEIAHFIDGLHTDIMRPLLSASALERVEHHRARGDELVIATAAATFFAVPTARECNIPHVLGTELVMHDGVCTGVVDGGVLDGERKLTKARAFAAARGVDLADCSFYSDHIADLPLMNAVGKAVAVGPHRKLRDEATRRGWDIIEHSRRPTTAMTTTTTTRAP